MKDGSLDEASPRLRDLRAGLDLEVEGGRLHDRLRELYPLHRSITGRGVRETLEIVGDALPDLMITEVPSGTPVLDWVIPPEWTLNDAYIATEGGRRVVDLADSALHVVGYSTPIDALLTREELDGHLHSLPDRPDLIPFRTSFYNDAWGFCLSEAQRRELTDDRYRVVIDASHDDGSLTYAQCVVPGATDREVLLTTHICHPSLANDNVSGIVVLTALGEILGRASTRYTYRLLFNPVTIGSIAWLDAHRDQVDRIDHGVVIAGVGDPGTVHYKRSRSADATIDRAASHVLATRGDEYVVEPFSPYGYDERQYCSPGFDLPVGAFSRTPHGRYPEYHTSADSPDFVLPDKLAASLDTILEILEVIEGDGMFRNLLPYGEPQLGRRGLYKAMGGHADAGAMQMAILWTLNLSDGNHSLLDIAREAGLRFGVVRDAADALVEAEILESADGRSP